MAKQLEALIAHAKHIVENGGLLARDTSLQLIAALEQSQQYAKQRDAENQDLMLTIGRLRVEREQLEASPLAMPEGIHPDTANLVTTFAEALAAKLRKAEIKYGYDSDWKKDGWQGQCLAHFHQHIGKGDPLDVAAYCAFMWHHKWPTAASPLAVKLPEEIDFDCEYENGEYGRDDVPWLRGRVAGFNEGRRKCRRAIRAAGGQVEGE